MSDSGKSSKFEVSSMLLISIDMAAGRSLLRQDREDYGGKRRMKEKVRNSES